ncbi:hypothetical protein GW17_00014519 [Ensete ventricosum]|nr:hypothetical protein GW17_00014519 [Ensete ventricosum]
MSSPLRTQPLPLRPGVASTCRRLLPVRPPSFAAGEHSVASSCSHRQWPWEVIALRVLSPLPLLAGDHRM